MAHILELVLFVVRGLLQLLSIAILVWAVMSWLIQFNVINIRHPFVRQLDAFLERVIRPVLWPIRRIIPTFAGVDISPLIALLIIQGLIGIIIDPAMHYLAQQPFP